MKRCHLKVGLVGCGVISEEYLRSAACFDEYDIIACADLNQTLAKRRGETYGTAVATPEEIMADSTIEAVLNLTPPQAHRSVIIAALESGKHVYSEKPFALNVKDADAILGLAERKNLFVASAPDSFMGATQRQARAIIQAGRIGEVFGGVASIMWRVGDHSDHPDIGFFFREGGGPMFDMGPYYITALVNMLGSVKRIGSMGRKLGPVRRCASGKSAGKTFPVEIDTHAQSLLEFHNGAIVNLNASFDVWRHNNPRIELYGSSGTLTLPEPSGFGGDLRLFRQGAEDWEVLPPVGEFQKTTRGLGLADLSHAIAENRRPSCSGYLARHVIEVIEAVGRSAESGEFVTITTRPE